MKIRVYYEDTDCGNVVYYANYLKYMERSRTEFLRDRGIDLGTYHRQGLLFAVVKATIRYRKPAVYDDLLDVQSSVMDYSSASITFYTTVKNASGHLLVEGEVKLACISAETGKAGRIPQEILIALEK